MSALWQCVAPDPQPAAEMNKPCLGWCVLWCERGTFTGLAPWIRLCQDGSWWGRPTFVSLLSWHVWLNSKCWTTSQGVSSSPWAYLCLPSQDLWIACVYKSHPGPGQGCSFAVSLEELVSHISGARGAGLQLHPRWERPAFVQGSLGWQHRLLVCQGYSWRWLKSFVAFPCSSALVISISDLFCLPGKTRYFWLPALQTQSGIWKTTSSSFSASKWGVTYRETSA